MRVRRRPADEFRLPRETVVRAASQAIRDAREAELVVSRSLASRLLRIARTAPEFALGQWVAPGRCGCLIGNLIATREELEGFENVEGLHFQVGRLTRAEYRIGMRFDRLIFEAMSPRQRVRLGKAIHHCVLKVTG